MGQANARKTGKAGPVLRLLLGCLMVVGIAACTPTFRNHGYVPTEAELADITVGRDTRDTVAEKIGKPGTAGVVGASSWYYVQSRVENYAYRAPVEIERQVVAVSFDRGGRVRNVERFGLQDGEVIALNRRVTDSNIEGVSFLRQLLGNVGRVDAGSLLGG